MEKQGAAPVQSTKSTSPHRIVILEENRNCDALAKKAVYLPDQHLRLAE